MKKRIVAITIVCIAILAILSSQVFADSVEYYSNGKPSSITTDKGTITYYSDGSVDTIKTPEGTATYNSNGNIDTIVGNPSISLDEAKSLVANIKAPQTTSTASSTASTSSTNLPNTGVENYFAIILPIALVVVAILGYQAFKFKNLR